MPMPKTAHDIEVEGLRKVYRPRSASPVVAIEDLSLRVERGEIFGLLGPNGAGKSTLVKILSTLTPPTSGSARVRGFDVTSEGLEVRRSIAVVLQTGATEMFLSVWENFLSYGLFQGLSLSEARAKAGEAVDVFDLRDYVNVKCQDLSGGYRRRVQAAKAFLVETPVLVLDEATSGMDAVVKRQVVEMIRRQALGGRTILLTTQILTEAEELCDRIAIIDHGRLKAIGDVHTLKLMARDVYDVAMTFEAVPPELPAFLQLDEVQQLRRRGNTLLITLRAPEARVLELLAEINQRWPLLHFEVSGASLEDVFVGLMERRE